MSHDPAAIFAPPAMNGHTLNPGDAIPGMIGADGQPAILINHASQELTEEEWAQSRETSLQWDREARAAGGDTYGGYAEGGRDPQPIRLSPNFKCAESLIGEHPEQRAPVVDGLCRDGEIVNMISTSKSFKSWTAQHLGLSIATGRDWLGHRTTAGEVLLLDFELCPDTIAHRLPIIAKAMGLEPHEWNRRFHVECMRGKDADLYRLESYFADLEAKRWRLIIIDAWYRTIPRGCDENKNADVTQLYNLLDKHVQRLGCAMLIIHHASKGNQSNKSITDAGSGAGAQSRAADAHMVMREHEEDRVCVLEAETRTYPKPPAICLRMHFPLWHHDPTLDPAALRQPGSRRRTASDGEDEKPEKIIWTPELFAAKFIDAKGRTRDEITITTSFEGISDRLAKQLINVGVERGLFHRWHFGRHVADKFSTELQPLIADAPVVKPKAGKRRRKAKP